MDNVREDSAYSEELTGHDSREGSKSRRAGLAEFPRIVSPRGLPRLILIGDGFTDPEHADRIVEAVEEASGRVFGRLSDEITSGPVPEKTPGQTLWVHLRDRAASAGLFRECAARLVERLRNVSPSVLLSVNGRPEVAEALQCGYHAGVRDAPPGFLCGPRQPYGRSAHSLDEARTAMGEDHRNHPQYLFFSPVFNPQGKPGYAGAGIDALRDFVHYVQGRVPVYALGGITPERVGPCLDAGSYGLAVLSGIMRADHPGKAAGAYLTALRAYFEDAS